MKLFIILGSINAFLSVALGAFGAHGLKDKLSNEMMAVYHTGVQYHMYHALGLFVIGLLAGKIGDEGQIRAAGWFMQIGIILFSGSLYALSTSGVRSLGIVTPFGGVAFLVGWFLLGVAAWKGL
ncbi:MAG TPA: DUF423 domain-containing protein [Bacillota bacterium]|nr:DUF423 domain-containing protein [Bacillota bacterium]